jgi:hydroxymethylpyrimidine pyrophosphatase-like HAD family hydrolase
MAIRLLALDLDGTLLDSRGELSERNLGAIRAARARGVRVVLVAGLNFGHWVQRKLSVTRSDHAAPVKTLNCNVFFLDS